MSNFPMDLLIDILVRLPPDDLLRCMSVSKAWNDLIRHQHFIKSHVQHSIKTNPNRTILFRRWGPGSGALFSLGLDDDKGFGATVEVAQPLCLPAGCDFLSDCSVNGLVCIYYKYTRSQGLALWNPSIKRLKNIPFPRFEPRPSDSEMKNEGQAFYEFGYDSVTDDYKVVGILEYFNRLWVNVSSQVQIYSLKSNSWKRIQKLPCVGFRFHSKTGSLVNNAALCWLVNKQSDTSQHLIVTLDLAAEEYCQFPTPVDGSDSSEMFLAVSGGCLCIYVNRWGAGSDVWIMKEYGVTESWTLLYSIEQEAMPCALECYKPVAFSENGEMLLLIKDNHSLFWCDLKEKRAQPVTISGLPFYFRVTICVRSICLLDGDPVPVGISRTSFCNSYEEAARRLYLV